MPNWTDAQRFIVNNISRDMLVFIKDMISGHNEELNQMLDAKEQIDKVIKTSREKFAEEVLNNIMSEFNTFDKLPGSKQELGKFIIEVCNNRKSN